MSLGAICPTIIAHLYLWLLPVPFLCASSCAVEHERVFLYAHYLLPIPFPSPYLYCATSLSPLSLYKYLTTPWASLFCTAFHLFPCFFSYPPSYFSSCWVTHLSFFLKSCLAVFSFILAASLSIFVLTRRLLFPTAGVERGGCSYTHCPLTPIRCFLFNLFHFIEFNYF